MGVVAPGEKKNRHD